MQAGFCFYSVGSYLSTFSEYCKPTQPFSRIQSLDCKRRLSLVSPICLRAFCFLVDSFATTPLTFCLEKGPAQLHRFQISLSRFVFGLKHASVSARVLAKSQLASNCLNLSVGADFMMNRAENI